MMETDWTITWLAPLMPDAAMIPEGDVFLKSGQQYSSLVAVDDYVPGLLFVTPDTLVTVAQQAEINQTTLRYEDTSEPAVAAMEPVEMVSQTEDQDLESASLHIDQDFMAFLDLEERAFI